MMALRMNTRFDQQTTFGGVDQILVAAGATPIARVRSDIAYDLAFLSRTGQACVARCTAEARPTDVQELRTMMAEGPFIVALLVSPTRCATPSSPVVCCSLDELPGVLEAACA